MNKTVPLEWRCRIIECPRDDLRKPHCPEHGDTNASQFMGYTVEGQWWSALATLPGGLRDACVEKLLALPEFVEALPARDQAAVQAVQRDRTKGRGPGRPGQIVCMKGHDLSKVRVDRRGKRNCPICGAERARRHRARKSSASVTTYPAISAGQN